MSGLEFHKPDDLAGAIDLLAGDGEAVCLAGGASLVAMMNAGLVSPRVIVSLEDIAALGGSVRLDDGSVRLGAMRRHRDTASDTRLVDGQTVLRQAAAQIANPSVRNMGTLGGSVALADPAADYAPALVATDAVILLEGPDGAREVAATAFHKGWYETDRRAGEIVTGARLPPAPPGSVGHYHKLARVVGDYAIVSVALVLATEGAECRYARIVIGGCGPAPIHLPAVDAMLVGGALEVAALEAVGRALAEASTPVDDNRASADYRRRVVPGLVRRAVTESLDMRAAA
jgi:carbon-monoxide dehydrogenase medium subunit